MTAPTKFKPLNSFQPIDNSIGTQLDKNFNALAVSIASIIDLLNLIARSDGRLANTSVHTRALTDELYKFIQGKNGQWKLKGAWQPLRRYDYGDLVQYNNMAYGCCVTHGASDNFLGDLARDLWQVVSGDIGGYASTAYVDAQDASTLALAIADISTTYETIANATEKYAPINSPTFTGEPKAPVKTVAETNDLLLATIGTLHSMLQTRNDWAGAQNVKAVTLTAVNFTINTDCSLSNVFNITLDGNAVLNDPTNLVNGGTYIWNISQDGIGSRTLSYGSLFKFPTGAVPVLTVAANSRDTLTAIYDGTVLRSAIVRDFK